jgi:NAD(P)-dependent dehydrogenase (short-subunit alcohol dehydrogenase family)
MPAVVVLGARNLGGTIIERFVTAGWETAGVARHADTIASIRARGAIGLEADALQPAELARALQTARAELGGLDLVVNAMSVAAPVSGERWGGGPIAEATLDGWQRWSAAISAMAFVFLSEGARALRSAGNGGTLIQISNSHALRTVADHGLIAAGHQALRALTRAAGQELRGEGIRVCMLAVDGPIWSAKNAERIEQSGQHQSDVFDAESIAAAVEWLANQPIGGFAHELTLSAPGLPWNP